MKTSKCKDVSKSLREEHETKYTNCEQCGKWIDINEYEVNG